MKRRRWVEAVSTGTGFRVRHLIPSGTLEASATRITKAACGDDAVWARPTKVHVNACRRCQERR